MPFTRVELCTFAVVEGHLGVLLGRRESAPFKGQWALPGGVLRVDLDQDLSEAAQRIARERLGVPLPYLRQQCTVGGRGRDPRSPWAMAVVYRALVRHEAFQPKAGKRMQEIQWVRVDAAGALESLAFDHGPVISEAVRHLRSEIVRMNLPFEVLDPTFTLGELQSQCEALLGHPLDKSSFRRRLDNAGCVIAVPGEFRRGTNRPAQIFRSSDLGAPPPQQ